MLQLPEYSAVRIVKLRPDVDHEPFGSSFESPPQPAVGDVATIIDQTSDGNLYILEKVREGTYYTDWLATFAENELELLEK
jgi:hypothetical protein